MFFAMLGFEGVVRDEEEGCIDANELSRCSVLRRTRSLWLGMLYRQPLDEGDEGSKSLLLRMRREDVIMACI